MGVDFGFIFVLSPKSLVKERFGYIKYMTWQSQDSKLIVGRCKECLPM